MKRTVLMIAGLFYIQFMMAQLSAKSSLNNFGAPAPPDDSFILTPDTLWFITSNDFIDGKLFSIVNPHNYSLDIQHIDPNGSPCLNCSLWYTIPSYTVYPVTITANGSISTLVKFIITDFASPKLVFDSLNVNSTGHAGHVILAADSNMVLIGMAEPGDEKIVVAPNPFNDKLKIFFDGKKETSVNVMIRNSLMLTVRELFTGKISSSNNGIIWDGTDRNGAEVPSGVYFITIKSAFWQKTFKVVKV